MEEQQKQPKQPGRCSSFEDIVLWYSAEDLRTRLKEIAVQQIKQHGFGTVPVKTAGELGAGFLRERLCMYVGLNVMTQLTSTEEYEVWQIQLELDKLKIYFINDTERGTLEQVLTAWLSSDPDWRWTYQNDCPPSERIKGYGLINNHLLYRSLIHMAAFALDITVQIERDNLPPELITRARREAKELVERQTAPSPSPKPQR